MRFLLALGLSLLAAQIASAQLPAVEYSDIDLATVRVLALDDYQVIRIKDKPLSGRELAVAKGGHGTGVVIDREGVVLTAAHVVTMEEKDGVPAHTARLLVVIPPGDALPRLARVIHADTKKDVAFLAVMEPFSHAVELPEAAPTLQVRQEVSALGYPLLAGQRYPQSSQGAVSGVASNGDLQLSMSVNPGNSGGPLIGEKEELLGIVVARGRPELGVQGMAFSVPMHTILSLHSAHVAPNAVALTRGQFTNSPGHAELAGIVAEQSVSLEVPDAETFAEQLPSDPIGVEARITAVLAGKGRERSDWLLACVAYLWNLSVGQRVHTDGTWGKTRTGARKLAERAHRLDPEIAKSAIMKRVLTGRSPTRHVAAVAATMPPDPEAIGSTNSPYVSDGSRYGVKDNGFPTLQLGFSAGTRFPYSLGHAGVVVQAWMDKLVAIRGQADFGIGLQGYAGHHVDAHGSLRLSGWKVKKIINHRTGTRMVDGVRVQYGYGRTVATPARVKVHSHAKTSVPVHAKVVLDFGVQSVGQPSRTCVDAICSARDSNGLTSFDISYPNRIRLNNLSTGLRYVRVMDVEAGKYRYRRHFELYGHLLLLPWDSSSTVTAVGWGYGDMTNAAQQTGSFGFEGGIHVKGSAHSSMYVDFSGGYSPATRMPVVRGALGARWNVIAGGGK